MSANMDEALMKNASGSRAKPGDAVEGRNALTAVGACFAHTTLDYVAQINIAHSHKDYQILDALWSFVRETSAFFSKGHAFFDEWTASDNGAVSDAIAALQAKTRVVERKMQDVHSLVPKVSPFQPKFELRMATSIDQTKSDLEPALQTVYTVSERICYKSSIIYYPDPNAFSPSPAITVLRAANRPNHRSGRRNRNGTHLRHSTGGGPFIAGQSGPTDREKLELQYEEASRTKSLYDVADSDAQQCDVEDSEVVMTRDPLVPINRKNSLSKLIRKMNVKKRKNKRRNSDEMFQHPSGMSPDPDVILEGYLNKRSSNAFKKWNRRWFQIKDNKLLYMHRSTENEEPTVMEDNLMLCLVRPAPPNIDRTCCFELVTPTRSHLLQADSESMCNSWMKALQRTILALHEEDNGTKTATTTVTQKTDSPSGASSGLATASETNTSLNAGSPNCASLAPMLASGGINRPQPKLMSASTLEQIRRVPGNDRCADCGNEQPKWVSINLGVVLCIECSGVHRSLGVQISKVRSLTMDSIDAELRDVLLALGNRQVNAIYLAYLPDKDVVPPMAMEDSSRLVREAWIKAKYVERRFSVKPSDRAKCSAAARSKQAITVVKESSVSRSMSYNQVQDAASEDKKEDDHIDNSNMLRAKSPEANLAKRLSSCGSDSNLAAVGQEHPTVDPVKDWSLVSEAARSGDILVLLKAMVEGFDVNTNHLGTTLLHIATRNGQTATVEFLLVNGAKINALDDRMNTSLHLAAIEGNTIQVCQLLKRFAKKDEVNAEGKTPLDIAVERKHADIVTLLRLSGLRDEFDEYNNPMDETVDVVISDIARRAASERENSLKTEQTQQPPAQQ
ncbi:hypothetical protein WR25_08593 [Diploscapter pachys]|uniref:Uncharacterized protein n=1 Tax=Diploscapter pachys TaxID=2018661 RepID=A0A2A2JL52_9BILA|nr:hypothetical protein WR25_08593 [Diploscapter pachys]